MAKSTILYYRLKKVAEVSVEVLNSAETILFPLLQVPDYLMVIKKPMDLSTLLTNIDEHKYVTVGEFMADADLIWQNALEYNPDSDPMGE